MRGCAAGVKHLAAEIEGCARTALTRHVAPLGAVASRRFDAVAARGARG